MDSLPTKLLNLMNSNPKGLLITEIIEGLKETVSRRTIQRELNHLIEQGKITRRGKARATKYLPRITPPTSLSVIGEIDLKNIQRYLHTPLEKRKKIGYQHQLLQSYIPNQSYYLAEDARNYLQQIGQQPDGDNPQGTYAKMIFNRFLLDLSWNSSRLEGNTYSLLETEQLLLYQKESPDKNIDETQMILNHKAAIEFLVENIEHIEINRQTILNLHALLSENLISNPESVGNLRKIPVVIGKTTYSPLNIPQLLETYFNELLEKCAKIINPFEQAFFLLVHVPYLQAFEDVNKRVSRLAANIPFIKKNLAPLSFIHVEVKDYIDAILAVYELNDIRLLNELFCTSYYTSVKRYKVIKENTNKPDPFKLKYRTPIKKCVQEAILHKVTKNQAINYIRTWSQQQIPLEDQQHFLYIIEQELMNLHEGNFARYQVKPSEFFAWFEAWGPDKR